MNILSVTEHDEICCPICETRHKMSEYITVYTGNEIALANPLNP
ncbi:MAG: hypothetical protein BWY95_01783 [Bacteroidetes bacterium ADurb.BinA104]|nr:MAG: hypothetical protein BWY95_01783 [Bacteroidetes bacterium ADurb.BinA104]